MPTRSEAEENLRVIRSLMEKATVYRAISAPGALIGGLLSLIVSASGAFCSKGSPGDKAFFITIWLLTLAFTAAANTFLLWSDAKRRGDRFISPGMKMVLGAMAPAMLAGGLSIFIQTESGLPPLASLWALCYGISLLAAAPFAPGSIRWLGRCFFTTAAVLLAGCALFHGDWKSTDGMFPANLIMGFTFGLFHLIYAACTWPRKAGSTGTAGQ